ncbi:MAG: FG-GAP-like repeat-containing protein [Myxococcota bacterium]
MILLTLAGCLFVSDKEVRAWADADGDGHVDHALGGDDCDDDDPAVTTRTVHRDADGDTLGDPATATPGCPGAAWVANADDCDDTDAAVGAGTPAWADGDGDGFGDAASPGALCAPTDGWADNDDDCDDTDASRGDETRRFYADTDDDGFGDADAPTDACTAPDGYVDNDDDCDDTDPDRHERAVSYADADGDGYGDPLVWEVHCHYLDGAWTSNDQDCDDTDAGVNPGILEWGRGDVDHDCDGAYGDARVDTVGVFFVGDYPGAGVGVSAANVGDLDDDGVDDIAVGLPGDGYGEVRFGRGAVEVGDPGDIQAIRLEAARSWWAEGQDEGGAALAAGDLDGDGERDLVVTAPADGPVGGGAVALLRGPFNAGALEADAWLLGATSGDRLGDTVAVGDVTGDAITDLAVSAPGAHTVHLLDGPFTGGADVGDVALATFTLPDGPLFGRDTPLALGDLDGDGRDDLLVGAPWLDGDREDEGGVYLCDGGASGRFDAAAECGGFIRGASRGDGLGAALAAGDLDADGYIDLVVGAPGVDGAVADMGAAYVFLGGEGRFWDPLGADDANVVLEGEEGADGTGGHAGASVAVVGDVTGWGGLDIAVGAPEWNDPCEGYGVGAAYVVVGPWNTSATRPLIEAADRFVCLYTESVTPGGCAVGTLVAPAGDLDRDGRADLFVGAPGWLFEEGVTTGAMAVVFGKNVR